MGNDDMEFSWVMFGTSFALVLPVELPDKTLIATLLLSTRYRPWPVLLGVSGAFAVQCVVAVTFGSVLNLLPGQVVALVVCLLFGIGAVLLLRAGFSAPAKPDVGTERHDRSAPWWRAAALSFGVLFAAEWGDASQLATAALTARYGNPLAVGLGAWLALVAVAALAVLLGKGLTRRLPTRWLQRIAGTVLASLAVLAGVTAAVS